MGDERCRMVAEYVGSVSARQYMDVQLVCGDGEEVWAHSPVLATHSHLLRTVLGEEEEAAILLPQVTGRVVRLVVEFLYRGAVSVSTEDIPHCLLLAHTLALDQLVDQLNRQQHLTSPQQTTCQDVVEVKKSPLLTFI